MPSTTDTIPSGRIVSIDALRGFDMFWIIGGDGFFRALFKWFDIPFFTALAHQFHHAEWDGFRFEDLIFPLFLFIVGLCLPFSITKRLDRGDSRTTLYKHIILRSVLLLVLGLLFNGILNFEFESLRYAGVLQRIALCYFFTSLIVMNTGIKNQAIWAGSILILYCAAMKYIPVPGFGAGQITPEGNLASYVDRLLLPGKFCCFEFGDNEGLLSTIPAISTTLIGVLCGHWLRSVSSPAKKVQWLIIAGVVSLVAAILWNFIFPINKLVWSSSYVLFAAGWSMILLGVFYWIIDIRGLKKWAFPFIIIGLNPITIYMAQRIIDFGDITKFFVGGLAGFMGDLRPAFMIACVFLVKWLFLYFLYSKKIFLKV
ncbi:MAG: DUF5009 domain-containing protein [Candidatus Latescibacteria bacterium]|nr:DUF5009 domain-containing protein [Candidatus Latescibacterota bacterium]